jgi:hypothetical protein
MGELHLCDCDHRLNSWHCLRPNNGHCGVFVTHSAAKYASCSGDDYTLVAPIAAYPLVVNGARTCVTKLSL